MLFNSDEREKLFNLVVFNAYVTNRELYELAPYLIVFLLLIGALVFGIIRCTGKEEKVKQQNIERILDTTKTITIRI